MSADGSVRKRADRELRKASEKFHSQFGTCYQFATPFEVKPELLPTPEPRIEAKKSKGKWNGLNRRLILLSEACARCTQALHPSVRQVAEKQQEAVRGNSDELTSSLNFISLLLKEKKIECKDSETYNSLLSRLMSAADSAAGLMDFVFATFALANPFTRFLYMTTTFNFISEIEDSNLRLKVTWDNLRLCRNSADSMYIDEKTGLAFFDSYIEATSNLPIDLKIPVWGIMVDHVPEEERHVFHFYNSQKTRTIDCDPSLMAFFHLPENMNLGAYVTYTNDSTKVNCKFFSPYCHTSYFMTTRVIRAKEQLFASTGLEQRAKCNSRRPAPILSRADALARIRRPPVYQTMEDQKPSADELRAQKLREEEAELARDDAEFIVNDVPECVAGTRPRPVLNSNTRAFLASSQADRLQESGQDAETRSRAGIEKTQKRSKELREQNKRQRQN
jgi:hypothetical protein